MATLRTSKVDTIFRPIWNYGRTVPRSFRLSCWQQPEAILTEIGEYAATRNQLGYTEEDVPRLIQEMRAEMDAEREFRKTGYCAALLKISSAK
jgi:hypothetical protein